VSDHGDRVAGWPPPHPSPPPPPPWQYGAPGTSRPRGPRIAAGLAALLVVALVVVVLVVVLGGGSDAPEADARAGSTPAASATASVEPTAAAPYACWDGLAAAALADCSAPDGVDGLRWVFPAMDAARCGQPSADGGPGVVTRVLCVYRAADGTRVQLGYFQWDAVTSAAAFYDAQGLTRSDGPELLTWAGAGPQQVKAASLYAAEPYSVTVAYPAGAALSAEDQARLAPRPADTVRGAPTS
jgi:hypothetical protein